jgi:hypothetical protein
MLVLVTLALSVVAFLLYQSRSAADARAARLAQDLTQARQAQTQAANAVRDLRARLGGDEAVSIESVLKAADDDLRQHGADLPRATYPEVVRRLALLLEQERTKLGAVTADKQQLQLEIEALEGIKRREMDISAEAANRARGELQQERADFLRSLDAKDREIASIMDRANTLANRLQQESRDKERIREDLLTEVGKLRRILEQARAPFTPAALARQKPDGRIVRASLATKTAWIGLGSKHGIQPQLTFSVQPAGFSGNPFSKPKAKLEVLRVEGPDLCEARIVESHISEPILAGDEVYNPAWDPGRVVTFAIAGLVDIDGDGRDDRKIVKQLITKSGGKVVAEVGSDGAITGAVTVETNYYLRGTAPDLDKAGLAAARMVEAMARMERTALDYGAVVIDVAKFLDLMGYSARERLVRTSQ